MSRIRLNWGQLYFLWYINLELTILSLDGFALNIGDPSQPFVLDTVRYLFDAAKAAGGFTIHLSLDVYASGSACYQAKVNGQQGKSCNGPDDYADILKFAFGYIGSGTYTKGLNGKPLVTSMDSRLSLQHSAANLTSLLEWWILKR
jgi:hypothetical protein